MTISTYWAGLPIREAMFRQHEACFGPAFSVLMLTEVPFMPRNNEAMWPIKDKPGWLGIACPDNAYVGLIDGLPLSPPGHSFQPTWHDNDLRITHYQLFDAGGRAVHDWPPKKAEHKA